MDLKKMKKIKSVILSGFLTFLLLPFPGYSAELPVCFENFPPFEFIEEGKMSGVDTEIVTQVLKRAGYRPKLRMLPWKRCLKYTREGEYAGIFSLTKTPEREQSRYFSEPINHVRDVFFKRKSDHITWKNLDDLKSYAIGASHGYQYAPRFMWAVKEKIIPHVQYLSGGKLEFRHLQKLAMRRIDLVICEISVCSFLIKQHPVKFGGLDYIDQTIGDVRPYYIAFSKKWPQAQQIVKKFNEELERFIAEGKDKEIFARYGLR